MQSIPLALTWELWRRGRWGLLAAALGALMFPVILFAALRREGLVDTDDPSFLIMHVVLVQFNLFTFGAAVIAVQRSPSRLYALPASTSTIVTWRLLPAMAVMTLQSLANTAVLNTLFSLRWPLWGPALFAAAALAVVQAVLWLAEKSAWLPWAVGAAAVALGLWLQSQYGDIFSPPDRYWRVVAFGDVATLAAIAVFAYVLGVTAIRRNRRGDPPLSLGLLAWLGRVTERGGEAPLPFRSPAEAQFWLEWRRKGWVLPATVAFGMLLGGGSWLLASREPQELIDGLAAGGGMLTIAGLLGGLVLGNVGLGDDRPEMSPFLATRPLTTPALARIILKTAAWSVLTAWLLWVAAFLAAYLVFLAHANGPLATLPREQAVWYFPATLLGPWIVTAVGASVSLIGRPRLFLQLLCGSLAIWFCLTVLSHFLLSDQAQEQFTRGALLAAGAAFILGTIWAFAAARRRALVTRTTIITAAIAWIALSAAAIAGAVAHTPEPLPAAAFFTGLAALAVAPLAAAPLALAWNRNR